MKPLVSFIIPVCNEERHIENTLKFLLKQDYPKDRIELIIADGNSKDNTVKIIKKFQRENKKIKLFKNPSRNTAIGRNICLKHSKGKYIFNFSGHCYAKRDFVRKVVKKLETTPKKIMGVGVSSNPPGQYKNFLERCINSAFSTIFGGFKSTDQNINIKREKIVRSVAFTAYRKEIFKIVGNFDEKLWCGQDGEFNLRLDKAGYNLLFIPDTYVCLQKRENLGRFWKQMYKYGLGAFLRIKKHPDSFRFAYLIPSLFVLAIFAGIILSIINLFFLQFFLGFLLLYVLIGFISTLIASKSFKVALFSPIIYFFIHFAYGLGFIRGMFGGKF